MKVTLCAIGIGGWYGRGIAKLINSLHEHCPGYELQGYVNVLPPGAPAGVVEDGYDYTGYCAKPFALAAARDYGADIAVIMDAAFYAVRHIGPLIDHIARTGYYFCKNGNKVGAWSSDRCLREMKIDRDEAFRMDEVSSYCVGLNFAHERCAALLGEWCDYAADEVTFPGPHTSLSHPNGRNVGFVSNDFRVRGHRHDQTVLSVLAHRYKMHELSERPYLTAYKGYESEETVLVNQGLGS